MDKTKIEVLEKFDLIVNEVSVVMLCPDAGVEDIEAQLEILLKLIKCNLEHKKDFITRFCNLLYSNASIPLEIFWFCMHELRWYEVRECVVKYMENSEDLRCIRAAELILESFSEDWDDAEMFEKYRKN